MTNCSKLLTNIIRASLASPIPNNKPSNTLFNDGLGLKGKGTSTSPLIINDASGTNQKYYLTLPNCTNAILDLVSSIASYIQKGEDFTLKTALYGTYNNTNNTIVWTNVPFNSDKVESAINYYAYYVEVIFNNSGIDVAEYEQEDKVDTYANIDTSGIYLLSLNVCDEEKYTIKDAVIKNLVSSYTCSINSCYKCKNTPTTGGKLDWREINDPVNTNVESACFYYIDIIVYEPEPENLLFSQVQKLMASDAEQTDNFGISVAISGKYAIVGAFYKDPDGLYAAGSAYIFENTNGSWKQVQEILASDAQKGDNFGTSVAISNNYAIVGAPDKGSYAGSAYIFENTDGSWKQVQKLIASDAEEDDVFGTSVAISNNYAIVGAPYEQPNELAGSAYIFERVTDGSWNQVQKLIASDKQAGDFFGISVAISNNYAIVGAGADGSDGLKVAGSAYIFENTDGSWKQVQKLMASDAQALDVFGYSVAISNNYVIVGAPDESPNRVLNAGSAYIFENTEGSWKQVQKLIASDKQAGDSFGTSVAISNNYAIVGAYYEDPKGVDRAGAAYIFERTTNGSWNELQKIVASDPQANDWFGNSVAISNNYIIVGAYREDPKDVVDAGAAYIFEGESEL
jgi:hypothetical protein